MITKEIREEVQAATGHLIMRVRNGLTAQENSTVSDKQIIQVADTTMFEGYLFGWLEAKGFDTTDLDYHKSNALRLV